MKKNCTAMLLLIPILLFWAKSGFSQTITSANYPFSVSSGAALEDMTGATLLIYTGSTYENYSSALKSIGFDFIYAGTTYTTFGANSDGVLKLGAALTANQSNNLLGGAAGAIIAPYWDDLTLGNASLQQGVNYKLFGTAPFRKLVVQWAVTIPKNISASPAAKFQVWLWESGKIEFVYGTGIVANSGNYSVGLSLSTTDFVTINTSVPSASYAVVNNSNTSAIAEGTKYTFTPADAGKPIITYTPLTHTLETINRIVTATITDPSGVPETGPYVPRIYYKKNSGTTYYSQQGLLSSGTGLNGSWSFIIDYSLLGGVSERDVIYYFIAAQDLAAVPNTGSYPAGVTASDVNTITTVPSAPSSYKILTRFSGTKYVGTSAVNGITPDYTSLTNTGGLFEDLNLGTVAGDLTIKIITDLTSEAGTVALNQWTNEGGGSFSVTIKPEGVRIISGSPGITLNGAKKFTIDGLNDGTNSLTINRTSAYGNTLEIKNGASDNLITRTTLTGIGSSGYGVIVFNNSSATPCSNNTVSYCTIASGASVAYQGILFTGSSSTGTNTIIDHNTFTNFSYHPIHMDYSSRFTNLKISGNEFYNTSAVSERNYFKAIFIESGGSLGTTEISGNRFHDILTTYETMSGTAVTAIYASGLAGNTLNIFNNVISLGASASFPLQTYYGVNLVGAAAYNLNYNSIYIGGTAVTQGSSYGVYKGTTGTLNLTNNVIYNARSNSTGTGKHYGIYSGSTVTSNFNNIYAGGTGGVFGSNGTDRATLTAWNTATGQDASSLSEDPGFLSLTTLTPDPDNLKTVSLNGRGTPLASIGTDINGNPRNTVSGTTDIGAYEFAPNFIAISGSTSLSGTSLNYIDGTGKTVVSSASGSYMIIVPRNWSGTVTPALTGYTFTPASIDYTSLQDDQTGQNYTPVPVTYTISGNTGTGGVTLSWSDVTAKTAVSDGTGNYSITVSFKWSGTLTPSKTGYSFDPVNISFTDVLENKTSQNFAAVADRVLISPRVFLQGAYNSGIMTTVLNSSGLIPLKSADAYSETAFSYTGSVVASIPDADVVDWVLVELRSNTDAASKKETKAAFLKKDGSVTDIDGISPVTFNQRPGNFYIVIRHRNHLPVMSASALALSTVALAYDFTTAQSQAYGTNAMKNLGGTGVFGMYAGDVNNDGIIAYSGPDNDRAAAYLKIGGANVDDFVSGYMNEDVNLNGIVSYNNAGNDRAVIYQGIGGGNPSDIITSQVP
ncbi:MAG: beta strand repeat-containing protein [Syntrophothermus sp.]